jgi:hypothetical protein
MSKYIISKKQQSLLFESIDPKQAAEKLMSSIIKKKYPYIIRLEIEDREIYLTQATVNIHFDLNKFYQITETKPPSDYLEFPYLLDLLKDQNMYLMTYVDEEDKASFVNEFNYNLENELKKIYNTLPNQMVYTKFQNIPDDYKSDNDRMTPHFYQKWKEELEPIDLRVGYYIPTVDIEKLKITR